MNRLFLYGDVSQNFEEVSKPFIKASGGTDAVIVLLLQGGQGWEKFLPRYVDPWKRLGVEKVTPIIPNPDLTLDDEELNSIESSTGIFVAGGDTKIYQRVYASEKVGSLIKLQFEKGIPYGGASAGALIASEKCPLQGSVIMTASNEYLLKAKPFRESMKDIDFVLGNGLGLIEDCVFETHFSEWGGFPRLVQSMELSGSKYGFGIDESACLEIQNNARALMRGRGRVFHLVRTASQEFKVSILDPGESIVFRE